VAFGDANTPSLDAGEIRIKIFVRVVAQIMPLNPRYVYTIEEVD
jgi:hypothetical protein